MHIGKRRGSLIVTSFMLSMGLIVIVAGISTMLHDQIRQAGEIQEISLGKLQAGYLAEMGVNHVMFYANVNPDAADPFAAAPLLMTAGAATQRYPFKASVALVRNDPAGIADCTVIRQGASAGVESFQVQARLVSGAGTFSRVVNFQTRKKPGTGEQWVLVSYNIAQ